MVIKFVTACGCEKLEQNQFARPPKTIVRVIFDRLACPPLCVERSSDATHQTQFKERVFDYSHREGHVFVFTERFSA